MSVSVNPLLTASTLELMLIWGDLVEAYHGINGYGGSVAEIYAYRLQPYRPAVHSLSSPNSGRSKARAMEVQATSANALVALCEEFEQVYGCSITIDSLPTERWRRDRGPFFGHRCHITVHH